MVHLKLIRIAKTIEETYGVFISSLDNQPICLSLERPWKDNKPFISCIPKGIYKVIKYRKPGQFHLLDVEKRTYILIHLANWVNQLQGCIAPGISFTKKGLYSSQKALDKLNLFFDNNKDIDSNGVEFINLLILD